MRIGHILTGRQDEFGIAQGSRFENVSKRKAKELSQSKPIDCTGELTAMLASNAA